MKDAEFVKLIRDLVRTEVANALKSGGDKHINAQGNIFLNPTGKAYYKNTEIGSGSDSFPIYLDAAHTAWITINSNMIEFHLKGTAGVRIRLIQEPP